jgi:hypothetical protein
MKKQHSILLLVNLFFSVLSFSQANTVSTGGIAVGAGGSSSYSIGQIDYNSATGTNGNINEGNQQPYEFYALNELEESLINLSLVIGPNPTRDLLNILVDGELQEELYFDISDEMGKNIFTLTSLRQKQEINLEQISTGSYFLKIYKNSIIVKTYQLIKTR